MTQRKSENSCSSDVPEKWRWKLRVFFSADVVGSTAYKASKAHDLSWAKDFTEFLREFPVAVDGAYSNLPKGSIDKCERMTPWKFSGDELLFHVELRSYTESATHIAAFKRAVVSHSDKWKVKKTPLSLKATAWMAGFPVTNREIVFRERGNDELDFIGPSIDLGFRIATFSSTRRFVLSPDLALTLLDAVHRLDLKWDEFQVFLHGKEELKGVNDGKPFPIVWLDMDDGVGSLEDELLGVKNSFSPHIIRKYLQEFLDETPKMRRPFIFGDGDQRYADLPSDFDEKRAILMADTERMYSEEEEVPAEGDSVPLSDPKKRPPQETPNEDASPAK